MKMPKQEPQRGFTLLETMVAMAIGLIVMAAMTSLFKTGMDSARLVTQRAETQQNMRAAIDLMVKDVSMAGAGLPSGGIQLPIGAGSSATKFACDQAGTCHVPAHNYPATNYMYGVIPGFSNGVEANAVVPAAPGAINDSVTSIYADYNFPLFEYSVTFVPGNGTASRHQFRRRHSGWRSHHAQQQPGYRSGRSHGPHRDHHQLCGSRSA
jgi:prepilin-type N-terminal cleavage/methylation domain-containing protein